MNMLKRIGYFLLVCILFSAPIVVFFQRQDILDWYKLRDYTPPAGVVELADKASMTSYGRKLFYVHKPSLEDKESFNEYCSAQEQTIVLGCYISRRGIYLFDVNDPRLGGIEEVTAAHEMLHAGYDRLSSSERTRVDGLTADAFAKIQDARVKKVVASYHERDASIVPNELHSILGTEVRDLPAELEEYYKRYFNDRKIVVAYSEQYEGVFTAKQNRIEALSEQISQLENQLKADRNVIDQTEASLGADSARLTSLRNQNRIEEYNAAVPLYNSRVNQYRNLVANYNQKVVNLNNLIEEYNAMAVEQKELIDAVDSKQGL